MKWLPFAVALLALLSGRGYAAAPPTSGGICGSWVLSAVELLGQRRSANARVTIDGRKIVAEKTQGYLAYELGVAGSLHTIDLRSPPDSFRPAYASLEEVDPLPGIYELSGDSLRICYPCPFATGPDDRMPPRPTAFDTTTPERYVIWHLRREKAGE